MKKRQFLWILPLVGAVALASWGPAPDSEAAQQAAAAQILLGRSLVVTHDCAGCHGGIDPASPGWLDGVRSPLQEFKIGPCGKDPVKEPCWTTRPRNLTPDNATGLGRFTERQIFNALRYGLKMEDTPDVDIVGMIPGKGNFPAKPHYLAPPMPWMAWRHMTDIELKAMAAYLHRGLKPSVNKVPDSDGPPDFWASEMTVEKIGPAKTPAFPTKLEVGGK